MVGDLLQAGIDRDHVNRIGYQAIHEAVWLGEDTATYATPSACLPQAAYGSTDRSPVDRPDPAGDGPASAAIGGLESILTERDHRRSPD